MYWKKSKPSSKSFEPLCIAINTTQGIKIAYDVKVKIERNKNKRDEIYLSSNGIVNHYWSEIEPCVVGWEYQFKVDQLLLSRNKDSLRRL